MVVSSDVFFVVCVFGCYFFFFYFYFFFFQAEDGIRDLVRSRGLGDVYKRQAHQSKFHCHMNRGFESRIYPS